MSSAFVVRSSDREHGGNVIEGVYATAEQASDKVSELREREPYWRIYFCEEYDLETGMEVERHS